MHYFFRYFWQVLRHKWFVLVEGVKVNAPISMLLLHDFSKLSPDEFFPYARNFFAMPPKSETTIGIRAKYERDFNEAWLLHQKRNKHHWQYWILVMDEENPVCFPMPMRYILEMYADWRGAGRAYGNDNTKAWYENHKHKIIVHPSTRAILEALLDANFRDPSDISRCHYTNDSKNRVQSV